MVDFADFLIPYALFQGTARFSNSVAQQAKHVQQDDDSNRHAEEP
jgi:hypothetical protein